MLFDRFDIKYNAGNVNELDISFMYLSYMVKNGPKTRNFYVRIILERGLKT